MVQTPKEHWAQEVFAEPVSPDWLWIDVLGDCSHLAQDGLTIYAANCRDMYRINWSAPRLLRPASDDWSAHTVCVPAMADRPTIGGLLLWKDQGHFLCLERGLFGPRDVVSRGRVDNHDIFVGRGLLPGGPADSGRIHLRLERLGEQVRAFCSADGEQWHSVGHVSFPVRDPLQVGVHAIGNIDRTIYPGAYPEGTAIRFQSFQLWQGGA